MPLIKYEHHNFKPATIAMIAQANEIIAVYAEAGYDLTLRQLYYQFVSRDLIPNRQSEYKKLGDVVSKGRRAGMIDWNAIVDRTRGMRSLGTWDSPTEIVESCADQFRFDRWASQPNYVECWFEKDALMGVFERAANAIRVPYLSCRGYPSDSEVWGSARRIKGMMGGGQKAIVLHFGDHDPSGIDMTRDIEDRLRLFSGRTVEVRRLALNMDQIEQYEPPPNPAKESDSRFQGYSDIYGDESWELDALEPTVLGGILRKEVMSVLDVEAWNDEVEREAEARAQLRAISQNFDKVCEVVADDCDPSVEREDEFDSADDDEEEVD